jgi:hypothetical protein
LSDEYSFEEVPEEERFYFLFRANTKNAEDYKFARNELRLWLAPRSSYYEFMDVSVEPGVLERDFAEVGSGEIYNVPSFYTTSSAAEERRQEKRTSGGSGPSAEGGISMVNQLGEQEANAMVDQNAGHTLRVRWVDRDTLIEAVEQSDPLLGYMLLDGEPLTRDELLERLRK